MATQFKLPEIGEQVESGDVVKVLVSVGDKIKMDQPVLELETDKADFELPSTVEGTVKEVHVKEGEEIKIGQLILTLEEEQKGDKAGSPAKAEETDGREQKAEEAEEIKPKKEEPKKEIPREEKSAQKEEEEEPVKEAKEKETPQPEQAQPPEVAAETAESAGAESGKVDESRPVAPSAPSVRRLARELGVDIQSVPGSGSGGRISTDDVKNYARWILTSAGQAGRGAIEPSLPDFTKWGEVEREGMSKVRRKTAENMSHSWKTIPHVTHYDKADITELEQLRKRYGDQAEKAGGKLTITAIAVKVVTAALKLFPQFAASVDEAAHEVIFKKYFHIGVAVETERGLLVPVIRDADQKNILELSAELAGLAEKARNKKLSPEEMQGGVFTITNLGGIGGTYFSPIVHSPEVAILGLSRSRTEPVFVEDRFQPRLILPLCLSYDHRLIDGASAARFLRWMSEALEQPFLLSLQG
ncbi:MAG: 2-oxo acid dehydrogenase subunit E2 [Acidobacteria bacterium]|nr:2-oxo acid dehydrogenase subunit E2 [Acidobacteriota bacterium]